MKCTWPSSADASFCRGHRSCYSIGNNAVCVAHPTDDFQCGGAALLHCNEKESKVQGGTACLIVDRQRVHQTCQSGGALSTANPVDVGSGIKTQRFDDWTSGGISPLRLSRLYNSQFMTVAAPLRTMMGTGWRTNFDGYGAYDLSGGFTSPTQASNGDLLHFILPDAMEYHFRLVSGVWKNTLPRPHATSDAIIYWDRYRTDVDIAISVAAGRVELRMEDGTVYAFDDDGKLIEIRSISGFSQYLTYDGVFLTTVRDSLGRSLSFEYETSPSREKLVRKITTSDGKIFSYKYLDPESGLTTDSPVAPFVQDQDWTLWTATFPDSTPGTDLDNPKQVFSYATVTGWDGTLWQAILNRHPLAGITDEKGVAFASWTYDTIGRVLTSKHIGGEDSYTFSYDDTLGKTTVTNPLGKVTTYSYTKMLGQIRLLQNVDGIASTNCVASNTSYAYDTNGFRTQMTDAESRVTKWTRNTRGLPLTMTEGFGTADARTTSFTWDATKPLATQVVAPGLTTNLTYNTDGQMSQLSQVDTTTTTFPYSTNGQTRTTNFGYTSLSQPSPPAVGPTSGALSDVTLTVLNPDASGGTANWTNSLGALGTKTTGACAASACFTGGTSAQTIAYQNIAVPVGNTAEVDAGKRAVTLQWSQAANGVTEDAAAMRVVFLDGSGNTLGSGPSAIIILKNWTQRALQYPVPANTRTIRLVMMMNRYVGSANDGYVDNIAVKLIADGSAAALPYLRITNPDAESSGITGWTAENGTVGKVTAAPCNFFPCFGETTRNADSVVQTIDIPSDRVSEIDNSARRIEVGWIETTKSSISVAAVEVTFLDASGAVLTNGTTNTVGQTSQDVWQQRVSAYDVPVGTRKIKVRLNFPSAANLMSSQAFLTGVTTRLIGRLPAPAAVNLLTSVDGPLAGTGDTVSYAYDGHGNLTQVTDEVGNVTQVIALTSNGLPATIRDPNGVDTTLAYNARDWLTTITVNPGASQAVTTIDYDAIGQVTKITEPDGAYLQYAYSDARRLTSVTNNLGEVVEYGYNANGDMTSSTTKTVSGGTITRQMTMAYDELGRLMKSIGASSQETVYSYDRTDLRIQIKDPRTNLYGYAYDSLQRLIRETNQESAQVNLTRNGRDDITAYQDPRTITTDYVRNGFGDAIQEASPDAGTTVFVYDARGLVTQKTDGRGVVTNLTYDNAGRLLTETYPAATAQNVTYTYDSVAGGNKGKGRLTSVTDQSGSTAMVYDSLGRVITDTRVIGGQTYITSYQYNAAGRVSQITYPSGRIVIVGRNSVGQVTSVTTKQNSGATAVDVATSLTWKPQSDLLASLTHGNGLVTTASYDQDYRISQLQLKDGATLISGYAYAYGDNLNLTGITDQVTAANSNTLTYTLANRLASASGVWGSNSFSYDSVGNRLTDVTTTANRVATYASTSNRLSSMTENGAAFRSYTSDGAGNTLTESRPGESFSYTYNKRNRLMEVIRNSVSYATYGYNAFEQMTSRTTSAPGGPSGTVNYIYDLDGHLIAEADAATGATVRDYIWLPANDNGNPAPGGALSSDLNIAGAANDNSPPDLPLAVAEGSNLYQVHADHLGRPIRMTDGSKSTVWQATWRPWGEAYALSGTKALNLRFPGQYFQIETGLHYNWHRHYDPVTGRYTQPDPLGFVDGPSIYAYSFNSPIVKIDRDGLSTYPFSPRPTELPNFTPYPQSCETDRERRDRCFEECQHLMHLDHGNVYRGCFRRCMGQPLG
ncbi:MAG: RHS repeat-associated core domain-containing protein [Aestuariivirga sp.]